MTGRYLLLVARPGAADAGAALAISIADRTGWSVTIIDERCRLLVAATSVPALIVQHPVTVIGQLFDRHGPARPRQSLDSADLLGVATWGADYLIERCWGDYIALLSGDAEPRVLRAPFGGSPCFAVERREVTAFAADVETMIDAGLLMPSIVWSQVARALHEPDLPGAETALHGVTELEPGCCARVGLTTQIERCWSPWPHAFPARPEPDREQLARTVLNCVAAWASERDPILVGVSGGLDSSVVAAALAATHARFSCLTLATLDPGGDERRYARALADHLEAPLIERWYDPDTIDFDRSAGAHLPRPGGYIHEQAYHQARLDAAERAGATCYFTGNGGDNIFYNSSSVRPVVDRFRMEGVGGGVLTTAADVASLTGTGVMAVLAQAALLAWRARAYTWASDRQFLASAVGDLARTEPHPWLSPPPGALPGKIGQVAMLLRMQHHLDPGPTDTTCPLINPLACQPLIECCLGIPSWRSVEGGIDRTPVRRAFADRLPRAVLDRRGKGTPEGLVMQLLASRSHAIRDQLLGGILAEQGLLDCGGIEAATREGALEQARDGPRLMRLLDAEAWCRGWQARASRLPT